MADQEFHEFASEETAPAAGDLLAIVRGTADAKKIAVESLGLLLQVDNTANSDISAAPGVLNFVELNSGTPFTADKNWTLPATFAIGDCCGVLIKDGDSSFGVKVKTADDVDTINNIDGNFNTNEFSKLFTPGAMMVFRGVVADAAWQLVYDSRSFPIHFIEFDNTAHYTYDSSNVTEVNVSAGRGNVGGVLRSWAALNITNTFSAQGIHYVYLDSSTAGVITGVVSATLPAYSDAVGYFVRSDAVTNTRCIGWVLVWQEPSTSTYRIVPFATACHQNYMSLAYAGDRLASDNFDITEMRVVVNNSITADVAKTAFDLSTSTGDWSADTMLVPTLMITHWVCAAKVVNNVGTDDDAILQINAEDAAGLVGGSGWSYTVRNEPASDNTGKTFFGRYDIPYNGSDPDYSVNWIAGNVSVEVELWGAKARI